MKKQYLLLLLIILINSSCTTQNLSNRSNEQRSLITEIMEFQLDLKSNWENPKTTPLKEDEIEDFQGISFFPIDLNYVVKAQFTPSESQKTIAFPTSANKIKYYKEYGKLNFELNQQKHSLSIYASDPPIEGYENHLFLPFMDDTNGETTYGGGRYLDFETTDITNNELIVDFNKAYNPYCAYSNYYNCPIPPNNNYLSTEIKAGESYKQ